MSHENKIGFLQKAKNAGYRVYLYFISTEDPAINKSRVSLRVEQGGHPVSDDKISKRYYKSLNILKPAIKD